MQEAPHKFIVVVLSLLFLSLGSANASNLDSVLLNGQGGSDPQQAIDSGRYEVRKAKPFSKGTKGAAKDIIHSKSKRGISSENKPTEEVSKPSLVAPQPDQSPDSSEVERPNEAATPSYVDQVKDLVAGRYESIEAYRSQVHPDDVRLNQIEINVMPGLLYQESRSSYSYRNYLSSSPFAIVGAEIWWTPFIGLYGKYGMSFGADVIENGNLQSRVGVIHEIIEGGVDFRKFFGVTRKANSMIFGLHYFENKFSPPGDNTYRTRTRSAGVGIHFHGRFPVAPFYSWLIGATMEPRLAHSEFGTSLGLQSGANPESSRMTFEFGGEFKLSREHQMVWSLATSFEKNQFSGSANQIDPESGVIPQGVSVTQAMTLLSLGYRWGH